MTKRPLFQFCFQILLLLMNVYSHAWMFVLCFISYHGKKRFISFFPWSYWRRSIMYRIRYLYLMTSRTWINLLDGLSWIYKSVKETVGLRFYTWSTSISSEKNRHQYNYSPGFVALHGTDMRWATQLEKICNHTWRTQCKVPSEYGSMQWGHQNSTEKTKNEQTNKFSTGNDSFCLNT